MPRNGRPKQTLTLTPEEKRQLQRQGRGRRVGRAAALRAQVILACSEGRNNRDVATTFALAEHTVGKWRRRFVALRLEGLRDRRSPQRRTQGQAPGQLHKLHELALALSQGAHFGPWSLGHAFAPQPRPRAAAGAAAFRN